MENENHPKIIEEANIVLTQGKMTITKLYETLVAKNIVEPDSRKMFEGLLEYAIDSGLVSRNKIKRYKNKKNQLPEALTKEQLIKLFDAIEIPNISIACALSFFCGLRISEVCNLKIENIDLESMQLKVVNGKNSRRFESGYGKDRVVPMPLDMKSPIKKWIEIVEGGQWLLSSHTSPDKHIRPKTLHEGFRNALKQAGLLIPLDTLTFKQKIRGKVRETKHTRHKYHFHTLRHSYATYLRSKGIDIQTLSELLGHNQITTTQIYAKMTDIQRQKAVNEAFNRPMHQQVIPQQQVMQFQMNQSIEEKMLEVKKLELEVRKMELANKN